jgi:hypothetical protein
MAKNSTQERRAVGYTDPLTYRLLQAEKTVSGISESKIVAGALKLKYEGMSDQARQDLINRAKNISKNAY